MQRNREKFYKSKIWKQTTKNIWLKQKCLCNRCGCPVFVKDISSETIPKEKRKKGIVHHKIYLNDDNFIDENISLNEDLLEGICIDCHNTEHFKKKQAVRDDLAFDSFGNLIKIK